MFIYTDDVGVSVLIFELKSELKAESQWCHDQWHVFKCLETTLAVN